jgi:uncharacterized protein with von Willebrand factor type A (vWA) domain
VLALVEMLRDAGVLLGVDDHVRIQRVFARVGSDRARQRLALRAVLARTSELVEVCDAAFDLVFGVTDDELRSTLPPAPPATLSLPTPPLVGHPRWIAALLAALLVALAGGAYALLPGPPALGTLAPPRFAAAVADAGEDRDASAAPECTRQRRSVRSQEFTVVTHPWVLPGAVVAALGVALAWFAWRAGRRAIQRRRDRPLRGSWRWRFPLAGDESVQVFTRADIHRAASWLAPARDPDVRRLDLHATIDATARHAGHPTAVYRDVARAATVGFVLERSHAAAAWRASFVELVERLRRSGAPVRLWWHDGDPSYVARGRDDAATIPVGRLRAEVDAMVFVGEPEAIAPNEGLPWESPTSVRRFARRIWLHPLPASRWGEAERKVKGHVPMAAASVGALARLAEGHFVREERPAPWSPLVLRAPGSEDGVRALQAYLGHGFAWLCAAAVAGAPEREVAFAMGPALGAARLSWSEWLRLATLPVFEREEWPESLREGLLAEVGAEALERLRREMLRRLEAQSPPRDSALWWMREREIARLQAALGEVDEARVVRLLDSPMRGDVAGVTAAAEARVRAEQRARVWPQWVVAGLGAGAAAGGAAALAASETTLRVALVSDPVSEQVACDAGMQDVTADAPETGEDVVAEDVRLDVPRDRPPRRDVVRRDAPDDTDDAADVPDGDGGMTCPGGMVPVPEGDPLLGDGPTPRHVRGFCIDRTEVTVGQYRSWFARQTNAAVPGTEFSQCNWSDSPRGRESHPINCVDWHQADAYCRGTGGTLPSDDEWEYAARGIDGREFPWGSAPPGSQLCWGRSDGTCRVGSFRAGASPFGALDMAGNVWEWTRSGSGNSRSLRGGSWLNTGTVFVRAASRSDGGVSNRDSFVGFRCVRGSR